MGAIEKLQASRSKRACWFSEPLLVLVVKWKSLGPPKAVFQVRVLAGTLAVRLPAQLCNRIEFY